MAVAAIAVLSSCSKEDDNNASLNDSGAFYATIEDGSTRTTLGSDKKVLWSTGDKISINGEVYTLSDGEGTTHATFTGESVSGSTFNAYYPADLYNGGTATLPAEQTYEAGKISNLPMYAQSTTHDLKFANLCGVLAITVNSSDFSSVNSIEVKSDKQMNGAFTASADGTLTFNSKTLEAADKKVTLNFTSAKTISSSETFYIAVPANAAHNFIIKVTGNSKTKAMATKAASGINVERNKIYSFTFAENAIQLWANGPYFALVNLGATNPGDVGGYYAWGATTTQENYVLSNAPYSNGSTYTKYTSTDGKTVLESGDDAATVTWGGSWRMPTNAELNSLCQLNHTWTTQNSHDGFQISGSGDYSGNSIFLPAAGTLIETHLDSSDCGFYWSSSLNTSNTGNAMGIDFWSGNLTTDDGYCRYNGRSIRPVLSE